MTSAQLRRQPRVAVGYAIAVLALVLAGASGCGLMDSESGNSATSAEPQTKAEAGPPTGFNAPDKIGSLVKAADQSEAQKRLPKGKQGTSYKETTATAYEDAADKSRQVLVSGFIAATGEVPTESDLDKELLYRVAEDSTHKPSAADSGSAGGIVKCIDVTTGGGSGKLVECGWINDRAFLFLDFANADIATASAQVPTILTAIVKN